MKLTLDAIRALRRGKLTAEEAHAQSQSGSGAQGEAGTEERMTRGADCRAEQYAAAALWIAAAGSTTLRARLGLHLETVEPRRPVAEGGDGSLRPCEVARRRREIVAAAREEGWVLQTAGMRRDGAMESGETTGTMDLVVPLGTGSRHGDGELRHHLRSALANVRGLRNIHIFGPRRPGWLGDHPRIVWHAWEQRRVKNHDIIEKFLAAARCPEISEFFVAGSDDWVFLAPVTPLEDFGAVCQGQLSAEIRQGYWRRCQACTRKVLEQAGKPVLYYDLHTPSVQSKAGWLQVNLEVRWRSHNDHAIWSLYHNVAGVHGPVLGAEVHCGWHAGDGSARPRNALEIEEATRGRWFAKYNDGGMNQAMVHWLEARFTEPAPWEVLETAGTPAAGRIAAATPPLPGKPLTAPRRPARLGKMTGKPWPLEVAVAVSCHAPYVQSLRACLTSIDRQTLPPVSRLVCLDSVPEVPTWLAAEFPHWRVERGEWKSPNPQRNLGWQGTQAPWVWFMDADNAAHPEYLAGAATQAADHVGIIHADLAYTNGRRLPTPEGLDYWGMRLHNYVDTAAVWRRDAVREAGGWRPTERWDDWDLALRVTAAGWHTARNPVPILFTIHPKGVEHRNAHGVDLAHKWGRSYGIVALLAGRKGCWERWRQAFLEQELPERCTVYLVDDSRSLEFAAAIADFRDELEGGRGLQVQVLRPNILPEEDTGHWGRHRRVCRLYNAVVPRVVEDVLWTWEDDNVPRETDAGRRLCEHWTHTEVGGICSMYEARTQPNLVCAARAKDYWHDMPTLAMCRGKLNRDWGFIPGGFAMFHQALALAALPFAVSFPNGKGDSWDGKMSRTIRAAGFRLDLDGQVEVDHLYREDQ